MNKTTTGDDRISAAGEAINEKVDSLRDSLKGFVDNSSQKVDALKTRVVEVKDQAIDRGSDLLDRTTALIKAHPLKSVAIAFGAGYIGMRLFRR